MFFRKLYKAIIEKKTYVRGRLHNYSIYTYRKRKLVVKISLLSSRFLLYPDDLKENNINININKEEQGQKNIQHNTLDYLDGNKDKNEKEYFYYNWMNTSVTQAVLVQIIRSIFKEWLSNLASRSEPYCT